MKRRTDIGRIRQEVEALAGDALLEDIRRVFHDVAAVTVRTLLERLPRETADPIIEALRDEWSRVEL